MKLVELIKELEKIHLDLIREASSEINPLVVLAKDEEGNAFYELYGMELESHEDEEDWLILWPAGFDLNEEF